MEVTILFAYSTNVSSWEALVVIADMVENNERKVILVGKNYYVNSAVNYFINYGYYKKMPLFVKKKIHTMQWLSCAKPCAFIFV